MKVLRSMCKRCLISEMDEASYFENMFLYIENIDETIKTPSKTYQSRLEVCKMCERLINGMCNACGCFVEMRAAISHNKCPYDKW